MSATVSDGYARPSGRDCEARETTKEKHHRLLAAEAEAFRTAQAALIGIRARITSLHRRTIGGTSMKIRPYLDGPHDEGTATRACIAMVRAVREHLPLLSADVHESTLDGESEVHIDFPSTSELRSRARELTRGSIVSRVMFWLAVVLMIISVILCMLGTHHRLRDEL